MPPKADQNRDKNVLMAIIMPRALAIDSPTSGLVGLPIQPDGDRVSQAEANAITQDTKIDQVRNMDFPRRNDDMKKFNACERACTAGDSAVNDGRCSRRLHAQRHEGERSTTSYDP